MTAARSAPPVQLCVPDPTRVTVRLSREAADIVARYADESEMDMEQAVDRLLLIAMRRRAALKNWSKKRKAKP